MFRTITAKYAGTCKRCNGAIAVGDKIRYGGPGRVYHLKADCELAGVKDSQAVFSATNGAAGNPAFEEDGDLPIF